MANPNGKKGATFERSTADYWRDNHADPAAEFIDRRVKLGVKDCGDLSNVRVAGNRVVVECKNERGFHLAQWIAEAQKEAANDGALCGIVIAKRMKFGKPEDQYAILTQGDLLKLLALIPSNTLPPREPQ